MHFCGKKEVKFQKLRFKCNFCVFWPAFGCCAHPNAGRTNFFWAVFNLFCSLYWVKSTKKWWKTLNKFVDASYRHRKMCFDQLLGARSTRKLVKIYKMQPQSSCIGNLIIQENENVYGNIHKWRHALRGDGEGKKMSNLAWRHLWMVPYEPF